LITAQRTPKKHNGIEYNAGREKNNPEVCSSASRSRGSRLAPARPPRVPAAIQCEG
jgi:hypothetical protein